MEGYVILNGYPDFETAERRIRKNVANRYREEIKRIREYFKEEDEKQRQRWFRREIDDRPMRLRIREKLRQGFADFGLQIRYGTTNHNIRDSFIDKRRVALSRLNDILDMYLNAAQRRDLWEGGNEYNTRAVYLSSDALFFLRKYGGVK